jgi:hypothetical protein
MAISGGDGSIILTTSVDTSGISRGSNSIKTMLQGVGNSAKATGAKIQSAFASFKGQRETFKALTQAIKDQQYVINSLNKEYAELVAKGKQNSTEAKKLKENINELEAEMRELQYSAKAVGTTSGTALGKLGAGLKKIASYLLGIHLIFSFINFSKEAGQLASTAEASVQRLIDIYGKASIAVGDFIDANARGLGLSKTVATSTVATYGNLLSVWAEQKTNAELSTSLLNQTAVVASKTGRTVEDVAERIRSGLLGNTEAIEDLGINVNIKTIEITEAFKRIADGRSWQQLNAYEQAQVRTLAILEQSTKKYGTEVANTSAFTRQQYNAAFQDFQATWGQVVNLVLMPILRIATRILNTLTAGLRVIAGLSGKTIDSNKQFEEQTDHIGGAVENQEALTDAVKDTAKEQKKLLAGFDDLEILSQNASGKASGGAGVGGVSGTEGLNVLGGEIDEAEYTSKLALIGMVTGWALVGLGIILMFSGHPFIGIGMVASGFVLSAGAAAGGAELGEEEKQKLAKIGTVVGVALIGLGVLLLFTKLHWKYGLAMIATGAMAVYSAYSLGEFSQDVKTLVSKILLISGIVAFTLGVILLFINKAGIWKYGLGLMALGVAEVVVALSLGGEELKGELQSFVLNYWKELYAIGALMVVVGVVLLFVSAKATWKYALTLIVAGIAVVATTTALGGDELKAELQNFVVQYWKVLYGIGALMTIAGIVLLFCKQWKYGFTLLIAGIASVVGVTALGGDALKQELQNFIVQYWGIIYGISALIVVVGIVLLFCKVWGVGLTLIAAGIGAIVGTTALGGDELKQAINDTIVPFKDEIIAIGALLFVVGVVLLFVPGCLGVGLTLLGLGATAIFGASKLDSSALSNKLTTELDKVNASAKTGVNKINTTLSGINSPAGGNLNAGTFTLPKNGYARGTVVPPNRPHLAWFGDNKQEPEIVSPVSTMKQAFTEAMIEMGGNFGGGNTEVVLEIDGREFGRAVVEQGNRENRRIGTRLVIA